MDHNFYIKTRKKYLDKVKENTISIFHSGKIFPKSGDQDFDFVDQQFWMMTTDYLLVEFSPLEKMPAIITRKNAVHRNFKINTLFNDSVISKMK